MELAFFLVGPWNQLSFNLFGIEWKAEHKSNVLHSDASDMASRWIIINILRFLSFHSILFYTQTHIMMAFITQGPFEQLLFVFHLFSLSNFKMTVS